MSDELYCTDCGKWGDHLPKTSDCPKFRANGSAATTGSAIAEITAEVERAMQKFPTWPTDPLHAFAVVGEEFGELQKEILQLTYEPRKSSREALRKEAVQLAAMSLRFLMSLDRYEFAPGKQHPQNHD